MKKRILFIAAAVLSAGWISVAQAHVSLGIGFNIPIAPAYPVYAPPPPVYYPPPPPVAYAPPVVYAPPPPVYVGGYYGNPYWHRGWGWHHHPHWWRR